MDLPPLLLFLAVTGLAAALAFACQIRHQRALRNVSFLLALFSALLTASELVARAHPKSIRVDLLVTIPGLCLCALVVGVIASRSISGVGRAIPLSMALVGGATLAWFGWEFVRTSSESDAIVRRHEAGDRIYWEETIRCQGAMSARFGGLDRKDNPCAGNLLIKTRGGTYPFTRVVVNDAFEVYLLAALQPDTESVFGTYDRPMRGAFEPSTGKLTASRWDVATKLHVELLGREDGSCEARIERGKYGRDILQLKREELPACPAEESAQVQFVGVWSKTEPSGPERLRLVQIWLWRSQDTVWGLAFSSEGERGIERNFNFLKRYKGKATGVDEYELLPYSKLDGPGGLAVSVSAQGARIGGLRGEGILGLALDRGGQVSDPRIRLLPLRDAGRFAAYFDTVLDSADVPWTPR